MELDDELAGGFKLGAIHKNMYPKHGVITSPASGPRRFNENVSITINYEYYYGFYSFISFIFCIFVAHF